MPNNPEGNTGDIEPSYTGVNQPRYGHRPSESELDEELREEHRELMPEPQLDTPSVPPEDAPQGNLFTVTESIAKAKELLGKGPNEPAAPASPPDEKMTRKYILGRQRRRESGR